MTEKKALVLIVDDNHDNIRILGTAIKSIDCNVAVAFDGQSALNIIEKEVPNLILLDVLMPDITGFQVCEKLKSNPKTKDIEIVFITSAVNVQEELRGLELGAIDYIHKPISIPIVQAKVELYLERIKRKHELELKNDALNELYRLRNDIERMMQHDLKTPLSVIMGFSQLISDHTTSIDEKEMYSKYIYEAGNKILYMIDSSLNLYKMEIGTYEYIPESIALNPLIEEVFQDLQSLHISKQLKINVESSDNSIFEVSGEKILSYSLFANLLRNAIEASPHNGIISIKMCLENTQIVIS